VSAAVDQAAHIASLLTDWPEPSPHQRRTIAHLLYGDPAPGSAGPSEYEIEQNRKAAERDQALRQARKAAEAMTACDVCNLQPDAHSIRRAQGIDMHEWTPGRADKLMKKADRG
jgi:hypothetical protein